MKGPTVESICVFGSLARTATDKFSDRDILIVSDDSAHRNGVVKYWQARGWAVSSYSPSRLLKTIEAGSLFVQHLRREGIILKDKNGWLDDQLEGAQPKKSYEEDATRSVLLAAPIERFESDELVNRNLVVADLAYVALRNFGICYLANRKRYTFDYQEIVDTIGVDFGLTTEEITTLSALREGKAAYRSGYDCGDVPGTVGDLRRILSIFFPARPLTEIDIGAEIRALGGGYAILRDFEAFVVAKFGCDGWATGRAQGHFGGVWKWIMDPRMYCWNIRNVDRVHLNELKRFLENQKIDELELNDMFPTQKSDSILHNRPYSNTSICRLS